MSAVSCPSRRKGGRGCELGRRLDSALRLDHHGQASLPLLLADDDRAIRQSLERPTGFGGLFGHLGPTGQALSAIRRNPDLIIL